MGQQGRGEDLNRTCHALFLSTNLKQSILQSLAIVNPLWQIHGYLFYYSCAFCMFEIFHKCIILNKEDNENFHNPGKTGLCNYSVFWH